jgi:hypothetical protein
MEFTLSKHATGTLREREIRLEWVSEALNSPTRTEPDVDDSDLTHALRIIPEFGYRILRVIYNHCREPVHVVTVYFDRTMKGKL